MCTVAGCNRLELRGAAHATLAAVTGTLLGEGEQVCAVAEAVATLSAGVGPATSVGV